MTTLSKSGGRDPIGEISRRSEMVRSVDEDGLNVSSQINHVGLDHPAARWVKVNVNAGMNCVISYVGVGGLMRDSSEAWMVGFKGWIGRTSMLSAEFWAIWHGLYLTWDRGQLRSY